MRALYVIATWLFFAVAFPVLTLMRKTRDGFWQRFGFVKLPPFDGQTLWFHGASAGDLLALSPMISRLRAKLPTARIVVSTMTNTGALMAQQRLKGQVDAVIYAPWDLFFSTRRAVAAVKPALLVLEYTEIWPNLIRAAHASGAKVALTNGRFSKKHLGRYEALFSAIENPLLDIDLFLMREDDEAERALQLGAPKDRVRVTGNTKFDALVPPESAHDGGLKQALGLPDGAPVWIAGSTHEGEEEVLLAAYRQLVAQFPELRLVIAPRYLERAERVAQLARDAGQRVALRSKGNTDGAPVVLLDTIGELSRAYALATVVFVGGSFTTRGGQNILEPAAQGKPVLFGPHMENFRDSVAVLVGRGGIQVNDVEHLVRVMSDLLARPGSVESVGELARQAVRQISGASERNVAALAELLS